MSRKKLGLGLALLYLGEIAGKLLALFVFGYLARVLGPSRYGDLEFAIGLLFVGNLLLDAGLAPYGAREAAQNPEITKPLAARIWRIRLILFVIATGALALVSAFSPGDREARLLVLCSAALLLPLPFLLNWAFEARGEMGVVAFSSFLRQAGFALGVFLLVKDPGDILLVPLVDAAALGAAVLFQQLRLRRQIGSLELLRAPGEVLRVFRDSLPLAISSLVWALRLFAPLLALYLLVDAETTGEFGAAHRLVIALHALIWLYFVNLLPEMSRRAHHRADFLALLRSSSKLVAAVVLIGVPLGFLLSPFIIRQAYGADFAAAAEPLAILGLMLGLAFLSGHLRYGLIALRRQDWELEASVVGVVTAMGALVVIGSDLESVSAAWILVGAEVATGLWALVRCRRALRS